MLPFSSYCDLDADSLTTIFPTVDARRGGVPGAGWRFREEVPGGVGVREKVPYFRGLIIFPGHRDTGLFFMVIEIHKYVLLLP